jgi:hypothetical protein
LKNSDFKIGLPPIPPEGGLNSNNYKVPFRGFRGKTKEETKYSKFKRIIKTTYA